MRQIIVGHLLWVCAVLAILPQLGNLGTLALIQIVVLLGARLGTAKPGRWRPDRRALCWAAICALVGCGIDSASAPSIVPVLVSVQSIALCLKLFEFETGRDLNVISVLLVMMVAVDTSYARGTVTTLCTAVLVVVLILATVLYRDRRASLTFRQGVILTLGYATCAVAFGGVLYSLVPMRGWGSYQFVESNSAHTGMSEVLRPGDVAKLARSPKLAFHATFPSAVKGLQDMYWRVYVLGMFDGERWTPDLPEPAVPNGPTRPRPEQQVTYVLDLPPTGGTWLPSLGGTYDMAERSQAAGPERSLRDRTWRTAHPINRDLTLEARQGDNHDTEIDLLGAISPVVPAGNPKTRALAENLLRESGSTQIFVKRALELFSSGFVYSLEPPPLRDQDSIDDFMFRTREGYCEHFASAYAVIMRMAGVPSRVVTGYLGGSLENDANTIRIQESDAHAWVEIWQENVGWVRVDPTSVIPPGNVRLAVTNTEASAARTVLERVEAQARKIANFGPDVSGGGAGPRVVEAFAKKSTSEAASGSSLGLSTWYPILVILGVTSAIILATWMRRRVKLEPAYAIVCLIGEMAGKKESNEGLADYRRRVAAEGETGRSQLISSALLCAEEGMFGVPSEQNLARARAALKALQKVASLREYLTFALKIASARYR